MNSSKELHSWKSEESAIQEHKHIAKVEIIHGCCYLNAYISTCVARILLQCPPTGPSDRN